MLVWRQFIALKQLDSLQHKWHQEGKLAYYSLFLLHTCFWKRLHGRSRSLAIRNLNTIKCVLMSLAIFNYLVYIESNFRQICIIWQKIHINFFFMFKKELLSRLFQNRINHARGVFIWLVYQTRISSQENIQWKNGCSFKLKTSLRNKWIVYQTGSKLNLSSVKRMRPYIVMQQTSYSRNNVLVNLPYFDNPWTLLPTNVNDSTVIRCIHKYESVIPTTIRERR